jgi:hypothetical protein
MLNIRLNVIDGAAGLEYCGCRLVAEHRIGRRVMNNKAVITSTVGYMCLGLLIWMLSMPDAGWFDKLYGHGIAMMLPFALMLGAMGALAFANEKTLYAIVFLEAQDISGANMSIRLRWFPPGRRIQAASSAGTCLSGRCFFSTCGWVP